MAIDAWMPAIVVAALTGVVAWIGHLYRRWSDRDTNLVQTDQLKLQARDAHIDDLRELLKEQAGKIAAMEARVAAQDAKIDSQGEQIRKLQVSDWALRRYVYRLIDFIRSHGLEPPEPLEPITLEAP